MSSSVDDVPATRLAFDKMVKFYKSLCTKVMGRTSNRIPDLPDLIAMYEAIGHGYTAESRQIRPLLLRQIAYSSISRLSQYMQSAGKFAKLMRPEWAWDLVCGHGRYSSLAPLPLLYKTLRRDLASAFSMLQPESRVHLH